MFSRKVLGRPEPGLPPCSSTNRTSYGPLLSLISPPRPRFCSAGLPNPFWSTLRRGQPSTCYFFFFFFHLTYSRWTSSLPSCLWSQRIFPSLPGSRLTTFLSRCKFSTLITRQPMVEFYLLTFPRFPLRKKEHKSYFGKNRTHDFRTSRCAAYLLDHSGDELAATKPKKVV